MDNEITVEELKAELRSGARAILQVRHAERPKIAPDDPTFGDALHLTREGRRTARLLGESLAEFAGDVAFASSPLTRTRETAECIAEGMGLGGAPVPTDGRIGNESFFYDDPAEVLRVFNDKDFFEACFEYFEKGTLSGFKDLHSAADALEAWLDGQAAGRRLFVSVTHDCFIAAFLAARRAYGPFSRGNWVRFLDAGATLVYPDGTRRYALVRAGLSHGICGVRPTRGVVFGFGGSPEGVRDPETLAWMRELRERGFRLDVLSGEERMLKPQARIYDLVRDRMGLHSDELCLIDDVEENCEGARRCGWHAVRFRDCAQARRDFMERFG